MHLLRVLRGTCLHEIIARSHGHEDFTAKFVNPRTSSAFTALYLAYAEAKKLSLQVSVEYLRALYTISKVARRGGKVRVVNAEEKHRPKGFENDPRSAVYVITSKERVSVDFNYQQWFCCAT
jgi:hypothetical protein